VSLDRIARSLAHRYRLEREFGRGGMRLMTQLGITPLPVLHRHALHVVTLPPHHRDPFDRLLVAQAQVEDLPILTADRGFGLYDVEMLLA